MEIKGFKPIPPSGSSGDATSNALVQRIKSVEGASTIAIPSASGHAATLSPADLLALPKLYAQDAPERIRINPLSPGSPQPTPPTIQTPTPTPSPTPTPEASPTLTPETPAPTPATPEASPTPTPETPLPAPEPATPTPSAPATPPQTTEPEPRVLVAEVLVRGVEGTLLDEVYRAIRTQPGRTTTRSQLQEDINAIFATGYFSNVRAVPEDTPLGVRVTFEVQLNPVLNSVQVEGDRVLPEQVVTDAFSDQYGKVLNLNDLQEGIKKLNKWYQDNGYVLAQVLDSPAVAPDGTVTLQVAEGEIESIQVRYINKEGSQCVRDEKGNFFLKDPETGNPELDKNGNPAKCRIRTRDFIITREFELKPGDIFNRRIVEQDLQRVYGLGILEDARLALQPSETDPRKVVVVANVVEKNTGSIFASAGVSSASGLFGSVGYQQQNLGGNNQKLAAEVQVGQRELLFDLSFTDPWIAGDPYRTSYTFNLFRRRTISLIFDGGDPDIDLPNGDTPRIVRTGGILSFTRPLSRNVFRRAEWTASLGVQYQRVSIRDRDGDLSPIDQLGNDLTFSGDGRDDLFTIQFGVVRDRRNDPLRPTQGSLLRLGTEQSIPVGLGSIFFNRLRGSYSFYIPTRFVRFTPGCRLPSPKSSDCPQAFAFNVQAGTVIGDLPPYESFALGGSNSVRGFDEGDLAAARSFLQGTLEYRFPIFSIISGALFVDAATDFGTQNDVPGNPGEVRNKPGSGVGYGIGIRVQSPLGPIRIDYGFSSEGDSRLHFGIGERF
ncbi:MAG: BamA/TamA family outer membrane protein [Leptolyngbyaceae cyanobacterium RU_5_1]|nr:BamA/TamA family outer membrane protein [Leptolyngbyaceae cyanobacterium RU_5_1]